MITFKEFNEFCQKSSINKNPSMDCILLDLAHISGEICGNYCQMLMDMKSTETVKPAILDGIADLLYNLSLIYTEIGEDMSLDLPTIEYVFSNNEKSMNRSIEFCITFISFLCSGGLYYYSSFQKSKVNKDWFDKLFFSINDLASELNITLSEIANTFIKDNNG